MAQNQESVPSKWPEIYNDLLYLIYRKLDIVDFIRFRAVCKSWYDSIPLSDHPPHLPFLLTDDFTLHSLETGKTHCLQMPNDQHKMFFGQSNGYLVTYCQNFPDPLEPLTTTSPCLFNPFTMVRRSLPFSDFRFYSPFFLGKGVIPNFDDDMVIYMMSIEKGDHLGFWFKEERIWRRLPFFPVEVRTIYKRRLFYCRSKLTTAFDLMAGKSLWHILHPNSVNDFCSLVESAGSLLGIVWKEDSSFEVYRLEEEKKPPCWVQMSGIGDHMIFLNRSDGFSISASSFDGISGNCIYFTTWNARLRQDYATSIIRYDLGKKSTEVVGSSKQLGGTWIMPNLCRKC